MIPITPVLCNDTILRPSQDIKDAQSKKIKRRRRKNKEIGHGERLATEQQQRHPPFLTTDELREMFSEKNASKKVTTRKRHRRGIQPMQVRSWVFTPREYIRADSKARPSTRTWARKTPSLLSATTEGQT